MDIKNVLTLVLAGGKGERLHPLTKDRAKPAVPFGGIYRIIDFTLSNAVNSGMRRIFILSQYKSFSLQRHIREGWNIFSRELGEFVDMLPAQQRMGDDWYLGTADSVFQNIYILDQERPAHVLILSGDHIYKMDYRKMLAFHEQRQAELTVGVCEVPRQEARRYGVLDMEADGRVTRFQEKPSNPGALPDNPDVSAVSMGIYVFSIHPLVVRLIEDAKQVESTHDFGRDIIPRMIRRDRVYAYRFIDENKKESKYWKDIGTIDAYYEANMDLVNVDPMLNLYDRDWPIRTHQEQLPPAKTVFSSPERQAVAADSILSGGAIISGGRVFRSILSPWVKVHSYSEVRESILMEGVDVGRYCRIQRAIIDKNVRIPPSTEIGFDHDLDRKRFTVSDNGIVVIPRGYQW